MCIYFHKKMREVLENEIIHNNSMQIPLYIDLL